MVNRNSSAKNKSSAKSDGELRLVPVSIAELPIWALERSYYRSFPVRKKDIGSKGVKACEDRGVSPVAYLYNSVWSTEETVVNMCLEAVLIAAPPESVAKAVRALAPGTNLRSPRVCRMRRPQTLKGVTGQPDFLLYDAANQALVMGEIKIAAKKTNCRYSFKQLKKYMQLGLMARALLGLRHVTHLIVLPDLEVERHCEDPDYWEPALGPDNKLVSRNPKRFRTMHAVYQVAGEKINRSLPLNVLDYMKPINPDDPLLPIPTYVVSWKQLCKQLSDACADSPAGNLDSAISVLQHLSEGRFAEFHGK
jgi:hypothetical protein